jgi:glycine oxidase
LINLLLLALIKLQVTLVENTPVSCSNNIIAGDDFNDSFDWVIDTRGLGAKQNLPTLRGVRGEVMIVETPELSFNRPIRLMHPRYKLYAVPRENNQIIIGATEIESEDMSPISLQSTLELSSAFYALNPAFAEARVIETSVNCRPALHNNLPDVSCKNRLISANGLHRHGYLLSPVIVNRVLQALDHEIENVA